MGSCASVAQFFETEWFRSTDEVTFRLQVYHIDYLLTKPRAFCLSVKHSSLRAQRFRLKDSYDETDAADVKKLVLSANVANKLLKLFFL